jgi:hypothetical protein
MSGEKYDSLYRATSIGTQRVYDEVFKHDFAVANNTLDGSAIYDRYNELKKKKAPELESRLASMMTDLSQQFNREGFSAEKYSSIQGRFRTLIADSGASRDGDQASIMERIADAFLQAQ